MKGQSKKLKKKKQVMNDFSKVYSSRGLKNNGIVTIITLPLEESIMVPVAQIIDLMKNGENVIFFSFNHDSIKINEFLVPAIKLESEPERITGGLSIIDIHQLPKGKDKLNEKDLINFIEQKTLDTKKSLEEEGGELSFIFIDLPEERIGGESIVEGLNRLKFTQNITSVLVEKLKMPMITASQTKDNFKEQMDAFMDSDMLRSAIEQSKGFIHQSDYILGIQRVGKGGFWKKLWKKITNFLLFWRKSNNFTLKVIKNRRGTVGESYKMNIDMDEFKTEIF